MAGPCREKRRTNPAKNRHTVAVTPAADATFLVTPSISELIRDLRESVQFDDHVGFSFDAGFAMTAVRLLLICVVFGLLLSLVALGLQQVVQIIEVKITGNYVVYIIN